MKFANIRPTPIRQICSYLLIIVFLQFDIICKCIVLVGISFVLVPNFEQHRA